MFEDFRLFIGQEKIDIPFKIQDGKILIKYQAVFLESEEKIRHFYYDENIYEVNGLEKLQVVKNSGGILDILIDKDTTISLEVKVNYKYFVKTVYQFVNEFIKTDVLQSQLEFYSISLHNKKEKEDIQELICHIKKIRESFGKERAWSQIHDLLIENTTYKKYAEKMSALDLLLLITWFIYAPNIPSINQEFFNEMVESGKTYEHALENLWRLAMNYDKKGYDFSLLDQFFLDAKDARYFLEYLSGVDQVNIQEMVDKLLATKDKAFIKSVFEKEYAKHFFDTETLEKLKENVGEKD